MSNPTELLSSLTLSTTPKAAIIIGATTGIGAAVARLFAQKGCGRVIIVGRDREKGERVLGRMMELSAREGHGEGEFEMVTGDVSSIAGTKKLVEDLIATLGKDKVDYLIQCQNGVPTGDIKPNVDDIDTNFFIQSISRFIITYLFTTRSALNPNATVMSIANPGVSWSGLEVDDLSMKKSYPKTWTKPGFFIQQSLRDSSVLDAGMLEFQARYPDYRYFHVHPGLVKTETFDVEGFPFPLNWLVWAGSKTFGTTPDECAAAMAWIAWAPEETIGKDRFFRHNLKAIQPGAWASNEGNRKALWEKLVGYAEQ